MASQVQIRPEPADHYLCHPNIMPDSAFCKRLVRETFRELYGGPPPGIKLPASGRPRVGMQLWFHTPAFLVDLFRKVNPQVELVSSDLPGVGS